MNLNMKKFKEKKKVVFLTNKNQKEFKFKRNTMQIYKTYL